jgi:hypothetical protein
MNEKYEVLNPWAETDPVPLRGISERLQDLNGKTIGLHADNKPAAVPILKVVEKRLQELYPTTIFTWFKINLINEIEDNQETRANYIEWAKGVDAVVGAIGD